MNLLRLATGLVLVVIALGGRLAFRTLLNPVTALSAPFAISLLGEELVTPEVRFGNLAALAITLAVVMTILGSVVMFANGGNKLKALPAVTVRLRGGGQLALWIAIMLVIVSLFGGYFISSRISRPHLGIVGNNLFDRAAVERVIAGTRLEFAFRIINFLALVGMVFLGLYVMAKGRFRWILLTLFGIGIYIQNLALAQKLALFLVIITLALYGIIGSARKRFAVSRTIALVMASVLAVSVLFVAVGVRRRGPQAKGELSSAGYALFGGPSALSAVLDDHFDPNIESPPGLGIAGLVELAALATGSSHSRPLGQGFAEVQLSPGIARSSSNIYTGPYYFYRDMGYLGVALIFLILGAVVTAVHFGFYKRRTTTRLVILVNFYLLLILMPIVTLTYYNFWWGIMLVAPALSRVFSTSAPTEATPQPTLAVATLR